MYILYTPLPTSGIIRQWKVDGRCCIYQIYLDLQWGSLYTKHHGVPNNCRLYIAFRIRTYKRDGSVSRFYRTAHSITITSHERRVVSNHRSFDCLFNSLCGLKSKRHQSPHHWPFVRGIHRWLVNLCVYIRIVSYPTNKIILAYDLRCFKCLLYPLHRIEEKTRNVLFSINV